MSAWLPTVLTETNREYEICYRYLTTELRIPVIRPEDLRSFFAANPSFLPKQSDNWLVELYSILENVGAAFSKAKYENNMLTADIIKTSTGKFVSAYRKTENKQYLPNVFLPSDKIQSTEIFFVDKAIYERCRHFFDDILQLQKPNEYEYTIKVADNRTDIVRLTGDVVQGHMISDTDIEIVTVGSYNLPTDVITKKEDVLGKFAAVDLKKGDYLLPSKVTSVSDSADDVFRTLDGTKQAISVTIQSFAGGLSGKLENGDIVQLAVYDNDTGKAILPGAFTYMKVITTTTDGGFDKDEVPVNDDGTVELPSTITLLANSAQIKLLVEYENSGKIHADLVYRGDAETAQRFLDAQDEYFKNLPEPDSEDGDTEETDEDDGRKDIIDYANDIINGKVDYYLPGNETEVSDDE